MTRTRQILLPFLAGLVFLTVGHSLVRAGGLDSIPRESLVFVESLDAQGKPMSLAVGVIVKKGFVALNYHYVVGASAIECFKSGETERHKSDGFLTVEEAQDLIVISVPTLTGAVADLGGYSFPQNNTAVQLTASPGMAGGGEFRRMQFAGAMVSGTKEIDGRTFPQVISQQVEECTGGPIFQGPKVVGFTVAGYQDENRYYAYAVPSYELRRLLNRSFIIKTYSSVSDLKPTPYAPFQGKLMESLESVLWMRIADAERTARRKQKMIVIDVTTKWAGWSSLMVKNTYSKKSIIRYLNENFLAVQLDAESNDTITFNGLTYTRNSGSPYNALAYSLLEGNMQFPSTVILDEDVNELLVIPGYMDAKKMEVVLHYFFEKAYERRDMSFQQFESLFWRSQQNLGGN